MRRTRTRQLTDSILGQHIALSVAAGLARTQLSPDPLKVYDAQHLSELLDVIARALVRVAPVYVRDVPEAEPRPLSAEEQEGASIKRGATVMVMKSGRSFSSLTMKRGDLRQAIAVLKAVGIPELTVARPHEEPARGAVEDPMAALLKMLDEVEALLRPPLVAAQLEQANRLALSMARRAPQGRISNFAMQLMSCLHDARGEDTLPEKCSVLLARLRAALEDPLIPR
jgi:hypothetical protein